MDTIYFNPLNHVVYAGRKKVRNLLSFIVLLLLISSCKDHGTPLFVLNEDSGIEFKNQLSPTADLNILSYLYYYNGAGVAAADFNNDGLVDIYFTGNQVADQLYLNLGDLKFKDITIEAGIENERGLDHRCKRSRYQ